MLLEVVASRVHPAISLSASQMPVVDGAYNGQLAMSHTTDCRSEHDSINAVIRRSARLVLRWVTVRGYTVVLVYVTRQVVLVVIYRL